MLLGYNGMRSTLLIAYPDNATRVAFVLLL
jgi:hypothetical protein